MRQKGFVPIIFIVIVLLVTIFMGGGIYWVQTKDKKPSIDGPVLHLKQISDVEKIADPRSNPDQNLAPPSSSQTSCTTVSDCGVNTCSCTAVRKEFLSKNMCAQACAGKLKCLNNKCIFDQTYN